MIYQILISIVTGGIGFSLLFVKEKSKSQKALSITLILIGTISGVIAAFNISESEEIGSLKPTNKVIDPEWTDKNEVRIVQQGEPVIKLGGAWVKPIYPLGRNVALALINEIDGLTIYAKVTSLDGKIVAKIIRNKWQTNPNHYFRKFSNQSSLEIIDEYDIPILQIELVDYNTVKIGGIFRSEKSFVSDFDNDFPQYSNTVNVFLTGEFENTIQIVGEGGAFFNTNNMELQDIISKSREIIKPWFDYSSPSNPSKRLPKQI